MNGIIQVIVTGVIMGAIDAVWLSVIANKFYKSQLGGLLMEKPNMPAAVLFYVIYVIGVVVFVLSPALEKQSWTHAAIYGALFGLVTYATYDLTNLSTLKGWPVKLVIVDLVWGMALTATVAVLAYWVIRTWFS
ncbi:DUF2177 family protein [Microbacteriaceae bacterium]|nr:DUF2177 family protein [Candidatus Saccharibacteria bacterium]